MARDPKPTLVILDGDTETPTAATLVLYQVPDSAPSAPELNADSKTSESAPGSSAASGTAIALFALAAIALVACIVLSRGQGGAGAVMTSAGDLLARAAWSKGLAIVAALSGILGALALFAHLLAEPGKADS
ncbi:hypothetical protein GCM10025867_46420 (plasmid) [Frondihabitans sucicola]|uniref:Integral membrane protein n=1 Tax=Frondihabitans sucicola TaxID=1268041 RepID=A0ABN6Y5V3_9MICO|nr:hypothetical protein [Frondihabitans sucicola]BDZ52401.1 hypothetical protein GCM10025867_46420 [Frondihabitans sucicola]